MAAGRETRLSTTPIQVSLVLPIMICFTSSRGVVLEKPSVLEYDEEVKFHTALLGILEPLKSPIGGFKSVVLEHLLTKRHLILSTLERWADKGTTALREKLNTV